MVLVFAKTIADGGGGEVRGEEREGEEGGKRTGSTQLTTLIT